ncbi:unnamed protein product [Lactuca virosa]|uniref:Transposase n=1 Tax=Lactuca virosa TaxID=75947 RepID=A0AAU9NZ02_9ASTR|nr:unnamed protein product [Lactuca virosa]
MHASYVHQTNKYSGASLDHELKESTEQKFSPWRVYERDGEQLIAYHRSKEVAAMVVGVDVRQWSFYSRSDIGRG